MQHKAGRELDCLIAEQVMGWHVDQTAEDMSEGWKLGDGQSFPAYSDGTYDWTVPYFSTKIDDAWWIVEHCGPTWQLSFTRQPRWYDRNKTGWRVLAFPPASGNAIKAEADTLPLAICLVALEAVKHSPSPMGQHDTP